MVRRVLFGVLWCAVFYLLGCGVTGAIAGGMTGSKDPENAAAAGAKAGSEAVIGLRPYLAVGAIVLSALGTTVGILPGTRSDRSRA
jgi:hypothetical protein